MSFPHYLESKNSGSQWLGEVPRHWEVTKLSYISNRIGSGKTPTGGAQAYVPRGVIFIRSQNVHDDGLRLDDVVFISEATDKEMAWSRVKPLDVLLNITGASIGRTCLVPAGFGPANVNQHVCVIRLENPESLAKWIALAMISTATKDQVNVNQTGAAREGLNFAQVSEFQICVPPGDERRQIARFLDHETSKIDTLIHEQKRLIELLKEKRQAVISHAVTKGLNPDVPMKDSGVEWLGEVPAHWERSFIKRVATIKYGIGEPPRYQETGAPLIRATNVDHGSITSKGMVFVDPNDIPEQRIIWLKAGDIIVVRSGAYTGDSAIVTEDHLPAIAGFDMVLKNIACHPKFLQYALLSRYIKENQIDLEKMRAAQPHLNAEELGSCVFLMPSASEQDEIVNLLERDTDKFDTLVTEAEATKNLLKERRSALISAAVTGKIDVRDWQPPADESASDQEVRQTGLEAEA